MPPQHSNLPTVPNIHREHKRTVTLADAHIAVKTRARPHPSDTAMARQRVDQQAKRVRGMFSAITNPQIRKDPK